LFFLRWNPPPNTLTYQGKFDITNRNPTFTFKKPEKSTTKLPDGDYKLLEGKFPLKTHEDNYEFTKTPHKFQNTVTNDIYDLKVIGFNDVCRDGNYGVCEIDFEDYSVSGGRRLSKKRPTARRRRSSKARKARKSRSTRRR
jgi:hypothetical protein